MASTSPPKKTTPQTATTMVKPKQCEKKVEYRGYDEVVKNSFGKLKCSSKRNGKCIQGTPIDDVKKCKLFCHGSSFFTWKYERKECYCKSSDWILNPRRKKQKTLVISGTTDCIIGESGLILDPGQCTELSPFHRRQQRSLGTW